MQSNDRDETIANADPKPDNPARRDLIAAAAGLGLAAGLGSAAQAQETAGTGAFAGKTAFVTGAARGIGLACAEELAKGGANIVLYDVAGDLDHVPYPMATPEDLAAAKAAIEALGVPCLAIQGDVRDGARLSEAVAETVAQFGGLDFMIANAGITQVGLLDRFTGDEVQTVMDINLAGSVKTVQAALPVMRERQAGRIVLMASTTGRAGSEFFPIYSATKWGMIGLAKSTALLMAQHNVTCNAVCPTLVRTKLLDNDYVLSALSPDNPSFEAFDAVARTIHPMPVGFYEPFRVAEAVRFLCSDGAALISGEVIDVGAGANARFNA